MPARRLVLCALLGVLALAACGRQSDETAVRETLESFADATARKDYQRLCDDVFSEKLVDEVNRTLPCEVALRRSDLDAAREPRIEIRRIEVEGDRATAQVRTTAANQPASQDTVRLVREGEQWRIAALVS